jgi:hypothetical protein
VAFALALAVVACSTTVDEGGNANQDGGAPVDCALPWDSVDQVFDCGSTTYTVANRDGEAVVNIVVESDDPSQIAAALAGAWNEEIPFDEEAVVWAYSSRRAARAGGYDRGVVSEQGMEGERLVFEICTDWEPLPGPGDLCSDRTEFTVIQD